MRAEASATLNRDAGLLETPPGTLALRVDQARQSYGEGGVDYLELSVSLANGEHAEAVYFNPVYFKLQLRSGLLRSPELQREGTRLRWVDGVTPRLTDSLAGGASFTGWPLRFDIDTRTEQVEALIIEVPNSTSLMMRRAVAPVAIEPCTLCSGECTYLDRDIRHCGSCGYGNVSPDGGIECNGGVPACAWGALCENETGSPYCADLAVSRTDCGECGRTVAYNGQCIEGVPTCDEGGVQCGQVCVDTSTHPENCGACGRTCGTLEFCSNSSCRPMVSVDTRASSCYQFCAARGMTCQEGLRNRYVAFAGGGCPPPGGYYPDTRCTDEISTSQYCDGRYGYLQVSCACE